MPSLAQVPVTTLKGVGPKLAEHLQKLDIYSVQDVLFHLPLRYEDRTKITPISEALPGNRVLIEGVVDSVNIMGRQRASLVCRLREGHSVISLRFFHFTKWQRERLVPGLKLRCYGEVRAGFRGALEMTHPEYRDFEHADELPLYDYLTPIYPTTKGLQQPSLRKLSDQALAMLKENTDALPDLLPNDLLTQFKLMDLTKALQYVHRPPVDADVDALLLGEHVAQQRLAFEELVAHQLSLQQLRFKTRKQPAHALHSAGQLRLALLQALPFQLTNAQQRVTEEVLTDMKQPHPMLRLVQGDVGCGKTIVAAMALLEAVESGFQAVLMAPTELLAEQHYKNLTDWLAPLNVNVGLLTAKQTGKARQEILDNIENEYFSVMVGTHALFQEGVNFSSLALIVIDEQHRFGVQQRLALKNKGIFNGRHPHQLIMTATPIPRTLAMTAYADLDYSVIDELPPGRTPVKTLLLANDRRDELIERLRLACKQGRQAYWVCTLIEDSEALQCQAAENTAEYLQQVLSECRVALVHGRQKNDEKESVMRAFKDGEVDVLVATTVVEVGVDVPNASLMVIENPERLGLAQLHQLRGRVGRGKAESHCVLLYKSPLSQLAQERLTTMRHSTDGFEIAKKDLEMRGPGEVLGTRQAGLMSLRIADLLRDKALLPQVQSAGKILLEHHQAHVEPLVQRWLSAGKKFANV